MMIPHLHVGQKLTLIGIDDALAITHRIEIEIRDVQPPQPTGHQNQKIRLGIFRQRGKRKEFYLALAKDTLVFEGWDIPFTVDTDGGGLFSGNACYNLVGDPAVIREWIETRQLNPGVGDETRAKILVWPEKRENVNAEGTLLYPEIPTSHAVIKRMKAKLAPS
jgi:hypothetical protein